MKTVERQDVNVSAGFAAASGTAEYHVLVVRGRSGVVYVLMEVGTFVGTGAGRIKCVFFAFQLRKTIPPGVRPHHITNSSVNVKYFLCSA